MLETKDARTAAAAAAPAADFSSKAKKVKGLATRKVIADQWRALITFVLIPEFSEGQTGKVHYLLEYEYSVKCG